MTSPHGLVIFCYTGKVSHKQILIDSCILSKIVSMSKLSKKKTEIKIENIFKEKFTAIYVGFMMVVFSIFYQNAFFNIAQAKRMIYISSTAVFVVLMLLFSAYSTIKEIKQFRYNKYDVIDILVLAMIASWGIGMLFAVEPKEAFLGEYNKCTGLIMYLLGAVAMYYLAKYLQWKVELIWSFLFGTTIVYLLQILNRFNIDPLGMYDEIADHQRMAYLSTLGHGNYNAAYNCLTIVIGMIFFYLCKEKVSKIVYGTLLFIGFAGSICCCADSVYLGIGVAVVVLFGYTCAHPDKWWDFYAQLVLYVAASAFVALINFIMPEQTTGFWGLSLSMIDFSIIAFEAAILMLLGILIVCGSKVMEKYAMNITRVYIVLVLAVVLISALALVIVNMAGIDSGLFSFLYIDDNWGTSRGSIWKLIVALLGASSIGHLLFGYGFNMVKQALDMVLGTTQNNMGEGIADAHNEFLNSLVTSGIIGTAIITAIIVLILIRGFRLLKENEKGLFVVIGLLAFIAQGMINGPQSITTPVFLLELGVFWCIVRKENLGGEKNSEK